MKQTHVRQLGMIVALIALWGCSKKDGQSLPESNATKQAPTAAPQASISFRNLYSIKETEDLAYIIAEFENTGSVGISAFKGKWTVTDDLDDKLAEQNVRFTGDTPFATADDVVPHHIISPGEKIVIVTQAIRGEDDKVYATTKTNVWHVITVGPNVLQILDNYRVDKKCNFALEKVVSP